MPSVITVPVKLPSVERAKSAVTRLENRVRWDPDASEMDADIAAIVKAYAEGKLIVAEER